MRAPFFARGSGVAAIPLAERARARTRGGPAGREASNAARFPRRSRRTTTAQHPHRPRPPRLLRRPLLENRQRAAAPTRPFFVSFAGLRPAAARQPSLPLAPVRGAREESRVARPLRERGAGCAPRSRRSVARATPTVDLSTDARARVASSRSCRGRLPSRGVAAGTSGARAPDRPPPPPPPSLPSALRAPPSPSSGNHRARRPPREARSR